MTPAERARRDAPVTIAYRLDAVSRSVNRTRAYCEIDVGMAHPARGRYQLVRGHLPAQWGEIAAPGWVSVSPILSGPAMVAYLDAVLVGLALAREPVAESDRIGGAS